METRSFQIGVVGVRLSSDLPWALDEYTALYEPFRVADVSHPAIEIVALAKRRGRLSRPEYGVRCAGRQMMAGRDRRAMLPEIESAVNREVVAREGKFVQLHAGAVVRGDSAVLLPADSGTGKTSLTAALMARGWRYLSDEFAMIEASTRTAHPFPKALCIKDTGAELVRSLDLGAPLIGPYAYRGKHRRYYLPAWRSGMERLGQAARIRWIFYLSRKPGIPAQLFRPTRSEAAVYAYRTGLNTLGHGQRGFETVVELVRECRVYQLNVGSADETARLLERALVDGADNLAIEPRRHYGHEQVPA